MSVLLIVCYGFLGALAGLSAGLFGVGGGVVIVPMLIVAFAIQGFPPEHIAHMAVATSLACIVFSSASSGLAHYRRGSVRPLDVLLLGFGVAIGSYFGVRIAIAISGPLLQLLFALFLFVVGLQMWFQFGPKQSAEKTPNRSHYPFAGAVVGAISVVFGIGGGTLTVPYLVSRGNSLKVAVGTSASLGLLIALAGSFFFYSLHQVEGQLPALTIGYIYVPALVAIALVGLLFARWGAILAHRLRGDLLRKSFSIYLWVMSVVLLIKFMTYGG